MATISPKYLIIDITDILRDYSRHAKLYSIYKHFPLQDIIKCILCVSTYLDDGEYFWHEIDQRFEKANCHDNFDWNYLALFHELLCTYLDEYMRGKVPESIDIGNYIFHRWLSSTTIMLQKDDHVADCNSLM